MLQTLKLISENSENRKNESLVGSTPGRGVNLIKRLGAYLGD